MTIKITLPAARKALKAVAEKTPNRRNPYCVLVGRVGDSFTDHLEDLPPEQLEPVCLVGVLLTEEFGVPVTDLVPFRHSTVEDLVQHESGPVAFTPQAARFLERAQQAADGRDEFYDPHPWGEIAELVGA
jgi:hypothetical protein